MTWRYADGDFDSFELRPIDMLVSQIRNVLDGFLNAPMGWQPQTKKVSDAEKIAIIARLKQLVNDALSELSKTRLWKVPQPKWQHAYEPRDKGSTSIRKQRVRDILILQVPVPQSRSDREAPTWIEEIRAVLNRALGTLKAEQDAGDKLP